jgi:HUS1 checkpoint protein
MTIMQDVPVQVLSPEQALQYQEPDLPEPDVRHLICFHCCLKVCLIVLVQVYITMPPLKHIRTVIDRMKNLEQYLQLQANMAGELTLRVESEMVSVATFFRGLEHPMIGTILHSNITLKTY